MLFDESWMKLKRIMVKSGIYHKSNLRMTVEGILWRLRTGSPWRDLPEDFGAWSTVFIVLSIAEATGKTSQSDHRRYFAIARGSALECAAALDACKILKLADFALIDEGKECIIGIVSMLSKLSQS